MPRKTTYRKPPAKPTPDQWLRDQGRTYQVLQQSYICWPCIHGGALRDHDQDDHVLFTDPHVGARWGQTKALRLYPPQHPFPLDTLLPYLAALSYSLGRVYRISCPGGSDEVSILQGVMTGPEGFLDVKDIASRYCFSPGGYLVLPDEGPDDADPYDAWGMTCRVAPVLLYCGTHEGYRQFVRGLRKWLPQDQGCQDGPACKGTGSAASCWATC
jgi:hypothetical protein